MALDALWAMLISEVSGVSQVQTPIHAGLSDTPAVLPEVSKVSGRQGNGPDAVMKGGIDTPDTLPENMRYQAQPAWILACTHDIRDTPEKINTQAHAANDLLSGELHTAISVVPRRLLRQRGTWLTDSTRSAAQAYHAHHFNCQTCIAAGRGERYGRRCETGLALWTTYTDIFCQIRSSSPDAQLPADDLLLQGAQHD